MEGWTASPREPKTFSRQRLNGCDVCVLLIGFRRGHVPAGESLSVTQLEYEHAREHGIDVLPYVLDENEDWPSRFDTRSTDPELERWRASLLERHGVGTFGRDAESLDLGPALTRWVTEHGDPRGTEWRIVVESADETELLSRLPEILEKLREVSCDPDLMLLRIERGSVILVLWGSRIGYRRFVRALESDTFWEIEGFELVRATDGTTVTETAPRRKPRKIAFIRGRRRAIAITTLLASTLLAALLIAQFGSKAAEFRIVLENPAIDVQLNQTIPKGVGSEVDSARLRVREVLYVNMKSIETDDNSISLALFRAGEDDAVLFSEFNGARLADDFVIAMRPQEGWSSSTYSLDLLASDHRLLRRYRFRVELRGLIW